jgi:hypothetical protein
MLSHVDRHHRGDAQGDGIAGTRVDLDDLAVLADENACEEDRVFQVVDLDAVDLAAELLNDVGQQVMRQWPGGGDSLQAAVNRIRLSRPDHDRKRALTVHLLEDDDLPILHLADDNAL